MSLDDVLGTTTGGWEQPAPVTELRIPDTAAPGVPGYFLTTNIPAELVAAYAPDLITLTAVFIIYSNNPNVYWYEGVGSDVRVYGYVSAGNVREMQRTRDSGPPYNMVPWEGWHTDYAFTRFFGPNNGIYTGLHQFIFQGAALVGANGSFLNWSGEATLDGPVSLGDSVTFVNSPQAIQEQEDTTNFAGFTNVVPAATAAGVSELGFSFIAPPSGNVEVQISGWVQSNQDNFYSALGWELRQVNNAGPVIIGPDFSRALCTSKFVSAGRPAIANATMSYTATGLVGGDTYWIRAMHWVNAAGGNGSIEHRRLKIRPEF